MIIVLQNNLYIYKIVIYTLASAFACDLQSVAGVIKRESTDCKTPAA